MKSMTQDIAALFARATKCHEAGQWQEAEQLYRDILSAAPRHADPLHQFSVLAYHNGRNHVAVDLVQRAIAEPPASAVFHNTLGGALLAADRAADAIAAFKNALHIDPASIETKNN